MPARYAGAVPDRRAKTCSPQYTAPLQLAPVDSGEHLCSKILRKARGSAYTARVLNPPHLSADHAPEAPQRRREPAPAGAWSAAEPADPVQPVEHAWLPCQAAQTKAAAPSLATACGGPPLRLEFANTRQSVVFAGGVAARGRAARPTNAGGNSENLQGFAGSE